MKFRTSMITSAMVRGRQVGYIKSRLEPAHGEIVCYVDSLFIDRMFRGHGHGTALLERTEKTASCYGATISRLTAYQIYGVNNNLERFYTKLGYISKNPTTILDDGEDLFEIIPMEKVL